MNLEFFVSRRKITRKGCTSPIADTANCDTFTVEFDEEWDGLVKIVELRNADVAVQVFYTGPTPIPRQVCGRGALYLTCHGYRPKDDTVEVIRTLPMVRPVLLAGSELPADSTGQPYTPSAFEQMAAQIAEAQSAAADARQAVRELLALKETGAFNGPVGAAATVQLEQVCYGAPARVENLGTEHHARLRFTLPYRMSEEEKEELMAQMLGDLEQPLDEILALQEHFIGKGAAS